MAWVDADYNSVFIDVGSLGAMSDSVISKRSKMGRYLDQNSLNIPERRRLPGDESGKVLPFYVVTDEAFGLSKKKRLATLRKEKFNNSKTPLDASVAFADSIIKCRCIWHNFVRATDGINFDETVYECSLDTVSLNQLRNTGSDFRQYSSNYFISSQGSLP
ncbi:hypothetical protein PR048_026147 [Dryococelus australis]|uniref:DDE Tnp4 domain-containing protein n=1 Tax=Dryococelus australis TaxID=614101 RepID=A0ABQ9GKH7_9NEOP|nr:hypothetical protein PR048_026147 [Dryococelus australis]